jgi:hypothetical protein
LTLRILVPTDSTRRPPRVVLLVDVELCTPSRGSDMFWYSLLFESGLKMRQGLTSRVFWTLSRIQYHMLFGINPVIYRVYSYPTGRRIKFRIGGAGDQCNQSDTRTSHVRETCLPLNRQSISALSICNDNDTAPRIPTPLKEAYHLGKLPDLGSHTDSPPPLHQICT